MQNRIDCAASLFSSTHSEEDHPQSLRIQLQVQVGDDVILRRYFQYEVPDGGLGEPPLLQWLFDSVHLRDNSRSSRESSVMGPCHGWITHFPASFFPSASKRLQRATLATLSMRDSCADPVDELHAKYSVTLDNPEMADFPVNLCGAIRNR